MSSFDAQVLDWLRTAKLPRRDKVDLLSRSLSCIEGHRHVDIGVKVRYELAVEIEEYIAQLEKDITQYGDYAIDEPEDGQAGEDADDREVTIDAAEHEENVNRMKGRSSRRKTVSSEVINLEEVDSYTPPDHEKSDEEAKWLFDTIASYYLFEHLDTQELQGLVKAMQRVEKGEGEEIFKVGEEGDTLYLLQTGAADMISKEGDIDDSVQAGGYVGDEQLMYSAEWQFTLEASEATILWALDRQTYRHMVTKASIAKRQLYEDFLSNIDFLEGLTSFERLQVADALKTTEYADGEKIIAYGEEGTHFHIIVEGAVQVVGRKDDQEDGDKVEVCTFSEGDCIGELEFINNHKTCADVIANGAVKTAKMGRRHFEKVMGPVEDFLKDRYKDHEKFAYYREKNLEK
eukprot:TRINITY_DN27723_c0_g1_i1.p2 TRINITY_DN27723_c0_g1~~TRINITY_DN27723_c0_g1_i1.p2  ORF type:complete len:403 (+),score=227.84 TRINITY_DN27723_c0_g1_i1:48-1256(+)